MSSTTDRITDIAPQKKHKDIVNIFINNQFAFALPLDLVIQHKLSIGQAMPGAKHTQLRRLSRLTKWYHACLRLLSRRPRSVKEIQEYFHKKSVDTHTATAVIDRLLEKKFLDDTAFAQWFVEQRSNYKPKGARALSYELRAKGIARDTIEYVLQQTDRDEVALAHAIAAKKHATLSRFPPKKQQEKLTALLLRRGFSWDVIRAVLPLTSKQQKE